MTDKQEPDIVERLRKYSLRSGYAIHCHAAADEIERLRAENFTLAAGQCVNATADDGGRLYCKEVVRLREQMSMMAQYGKPPAQLADGIHTCSYYCDRPACVKRQRDELREGVKRHEEMANMASDEIADLTAQPAPAQEPQPVSNTDELPQRLSDERIMHFWDIHAGMPTEKYPLNYKDVRAFARAIEAAIVPPGYVVVPVEIVNRFPEINPSNYGPDEVDALNAWGIELVAAAAPKDTL